MKMTTMQYILLGAFALFALGGVLVFAGFGGTSRTSSETADISMWGVVPSSVIFSITDVINTKTPDAIKIIYTQKDESRLSVDLIEALADGNGPDVIMLPHNLLLELENKISNIPFSLLSERTFKDTFIESGEVFLNPVGTYAMPYIVDPLVMYWNRDIFSAKNFISPPRLWEEATVISSTVTEMSESKVIRKSGLSLGEFQNVTNAKEIILSLAAQVGSKLIQRNATGESYDNVILKNRGQSLVLPFEAAITFYTDFANPTSLRYSWNRSLPDSQKQFLSGKLAMYFGFAS